MPSDFTTIFLVLMILLLKSTSYRPRFYTTPNLLIAQTNMGRELITISITECLNLVALNLFIQRSTT
jgi:hypothetical protein